MTAQQHEILIIDGHRTSMAFCPPLPDTEPSPQEGSKFSLSSNSSLWRGYVGTWEIIEDKFYLNEIKSFKIQLVNKCPALATWFTGMLRIPKGEILEYVHLGFGSVFEYELHIKIEKGIVTKTKTIDNRNKKIDELKIANDYFKKGQNKFDGDDE